MKIYGTAKGGAISKKDFGVAFGGGAPSVDYSWIDVQSTYTIDGNKITRSGTGWDAYCLSTNGSPASTGLTLSAITGGSASSYVSYTWLDGSDNPRGKTSGNWDEQVMSYGWYFTNNPSEDGAKIRIDGGTIGSPYAYTENVTVFKVVMTADDVKFYLDDVLKYTADSGTGEQPDASKTYYMIGSGYENDGYITGAMA